MDHTEQRAECAIKFANLEGTAKDYKKHEEESIEVRDMVKKHENFIDDFKLQRNILTGSIVAMVATIISIAVTWGITLNRVNTLEKYTDFILKRSLSNDRP